ncbi:signal recognition particle protein, partial [Eubacteriales bacterium OttesenSCG-928-K08]|nr:signal recognition particle protein [Eubacteriales bacterium OttesenSCG-928-K08]
DIEPFHPDRIASRILGMGDMLSLIEKAQEAFDEKKAEELSQKLRDDTFTLDDFLDQFQQMRSMGSVQDILGMMPGIDTSKLGGVEVDEKQVKRMEAIIQSMTKEERARPDILNAGRRKRIAKGSGTSIQEVNRLLNQYDQTRKMMRQFSGGGKKGKRGRKNRIQFPF